MKYSSISVLLRSTEGIDRIAVGRGMGQHNAVLQPRLEGEEGTKTWTEEARCRESCMNACSMQTDTTAYQAGMSVCVI